MEKPLPHGWVSSLELTVLEKNVIDAERSFLLAKKDRLQLEVQRDQEMSILTKRLRLLRIQAKRIEKRYETAVQRARLKMQARALKRGKR